MNQEEILYALALKLTTGIGDVTVKKIIEQTGSAKTAWLTKKQDLAVAIQQKNILKSNLGDDAILELAKKELDFLQKNNYQLYYYLNQDYPSLLKETPDAPLLLFAKGNVKEALNNSLLSIVGTRNCTPYGKDFLVQLMKDLGEYSITYVSGLAYGIDKIVHEEALKNNYPTIGVVAHGLQTLYPSVHKNIASNMLVNGGILTEYTSLEAMHPTFFINRNRIIAGLSKATLIIESDFKGGSLATANFANDYNREVLALPGKTTDKYSTGCNNLIKQNKAMLFSTAEDVLNALNLIKKKKEVVKKELFVVLEEPHNTIFELIAKDEKLHLDQLSLALNLPTYKLMPILLDLELKDLIKTLSGSYYQLNVT